MAKASSAKTASKIAGAHAVLGMDMVAFSRLDDDEQILAIEWIIRWISEALAYHSIPQSEYRWSPAGDGGYLTFAGQSACRKAIDVAFSIADKIQRQRPDWVPRTGPIRLRFGLHFGTVREARELGRATNIWGLGINTTARILTVSAPLQVLVSKQYYDTYIKGQRDDEFEVGELHWRTVKHGVQLEVLNISRQRLGLDRPAAIAQRWQAIGGLWQRTIAEYVFLVNDAMNTGEPVAAVAAAKVLLDLETPGPVRELCHMIGKTEQRPAAPYPPREHQLFSLMPPDVLFRLIEHATLRPLEPGEVICERGDPAKSCFFPVSGTVAAEVANVDQPYRIPNGQLVGEFSLWIPNLPRTARLRALDDALLLEIDRDRFRSVLNGVPHVEDVVYSIIKQRIVENVLKSPLFPEVGASLAASALEATCEKHQPGTRLDLVKWSHVIVNGRVDLAPPRGHAVGIQADGQFSRLPVVGLVSDIGTPDGPEAAVVDETVAVRMNREALRDLQRKSRAVRDAWNGLCGERMGEIGWQPGGGS